MANQFFARTALTGGAAGAIDAIDGARLADGDVVATFIASSQTMYVHVLDADSAASESSPDVIAPDSNAGNKRFLLSNLILGGINARNYLAVTSTSLATSYGVSLTSHKFGVRVDYSTTYTAPSGGATLIAPSIADLYIDNVTNTAGIGAFAGIVMSAGRNAGTPASGVCTGFIRAIRPVGDGTVSAELAFGGRTGEYMRLTSTGLGILTDAPSCALDVNSDLLRLRTAKTPATAGATGNAGNICWDSGAIYVCVAANTWKKAAIATW